MEKACREKAVSPSIRRAARQPGWRHVFRMGAEQRLDGRKKRLGEKERTVVFPAPENPHGHGMLALSEIGSDRALYRISRGAAAVPKSRETNAADATRPSRLVCAFRGRRGGPLLRLCFDAPCVRG